MRALDQDPFTPDPAICPSDGSVTAIDPGPKQSGVVVLDGGRITYAKVLSNLDLLAQLRCGDYTSTCLAVEMITSYGMPVGREVFETCVWIGRFIEACAPQPVALATRLEVKTALCHSAKAKDANVRQALIDVIGPPGTKKNPGPTYGVTGDAWSALALAYVVSEGLAGKHNARPV